MEKTYYVATLIFGWFITVSLAVFMYFAFKLGYSLIGIVMTMIVIASAAMNTLFLKKWKKAV
ncbi:hypothetical protein [Lederbergia citrea]|uniref:hypothetical protein n=1 Tax=Lederbergia citrea TaxID=2833581 RepID=UPI001BC8F291|nr:hypothetical protein [Lederbergia citrea]MBS4203497.1 hypothetical protein [Lederbergia citrea]